MWGGWGPLILTSGGGGDKKTGKTTEGKQSINAVLVQDLLCQSSYNTHTWLRLLKRWLLHPALHFCQGLLLGKWVFSTVPWRERKRDTPSQTKRVTTIPHHPLQEPWDQISTKAAKMSLHGALMSQAPATLFLIQPTSALEWIISNKLAQRSTVS